MSAQDRFIWLVAGLLILSLAVVGCSRESLVKADLALINGKVWTVDSDRPEAQAVAIWQGRILAVGANDEIQPLIGDQTQVVDLSGERRKNNDRLVAQLRRVSVGRVSTEGSADPPEPGAWVVSDCLAMIE